jgi:hypothetical protein
MKIDREGLLAKLESVEPGLSTKEVVDQSSAYIFDGATVTTFNGEIAARSPCELVGVSGAVSARHLKDLLLRLTDDAVDITTSDGELRLRARSGRGVVAMQAEIRLPVDQIETPDPEGWCDLHPEFGDAVEVVGACAAKDDNNYKLLCVHITPGYVEACDNYQLARYPLPTGLASRSMVRRDSLRHVVALGMTQAAETETWVHFRNPAGLALSMRRWSEDYEDLDLLLDAVQDTTPATLPGGMDEAMERTGVFSADSHTGDVVHVALTGGRMQLRGEGAGGWWEERKAVKYTGPDIAFMIAPKLLTEIADRAQDCEIAPGALRVDNGKFVYMTCLSSAGE